MDGILVSAKLEVDYLEVRTEGEDVPEDGDAIPLGGVVVTIRWGEDSVEGTEGLKRFLWTELIWDSAKQKVQEPPYRTSTIIMYWSVTLRSKLSSIIT